jgi:hypothetical protein
MKLVSKENVFLMLVTETRARGATMMDARAVISDRREITEMSPKKGEAISGYSETRGKTRRWHLSLSSALYLSYLACHLKARCVAKKGQAKCVAKKGQAKCVAKKGQAKCAAKKGQAKCVAKKGQAKCVAK